MLQWCNAARHQNTHRNNSEHQTDNRKPNRGDHLIVEIRLALRAKLCHLGIDIINIDARPQYPIPFRQVFGITQFRRLRINRRFVPREIEESIARFRGIN
ncbi:Uncharacterised protein [Vibrio cholerae]|nr:Uncharacterised protein [Vibrio cholerae]CSC43132.1 Uncharacterised protein [Vibrio cholerae]CSC50945.1 Uncharacterised protein [Vibrio cholerae]CSC72145.1 Uncharacterised protein [Vibrio cholerae]